MPELPFLLSLKVKNAIRQAMQVRKKDRPENVKGFLDLMDTSTSAVSNEEAKIVQPQAKSIGDEATMVLDKLEVKEKIEHPQIVGDTSRSVDSINEIKNKADIIRFLIVFILVCLIFILGNW